MVQVLDERIARHEGQAGQFEEFDRLMENCGKAEEDIIIVGSGMTELGYRAITMVLG